MSRLQPETSHEDPQEDEKMADRRMFDKNDIFTEQRWAYVKPYKAIFFPLVRINTINLLTYTVKLKFNCKMCSDIVLVKISSPEYSESFGKEMPNKGATLVNNIWLLSVKI